MDFDLEREAGNYPFIIKGQNFRVLEKDYFQQCRMAGYIEHLNDPFSDDGINAQRRLFGEIQWESSTDKWAFLVPDQLQILMGKFKGGALKNGLDLVTEIANGLNDAFISTGAENHSQKSEAQPVESSAEANSKTKSPLTEIYEKSRQT